jgi:hypothetical protein
MNVLFKWPNVFCRFGKNVYSKRIAIDKIIKNKVNKLNLKRQVRIYKLPCDQIKTWVE